FRAEPFQTVKPVEFRGVRPVGGQRAVVRLAAWQISHGRDVKSAPVIGIVTAAVPIGRIGVGEARIITSEVAPQITYASPEVRGRLTSKADFEAVIAAVRFLRAGALRTERNRIEVVSVCVRCAGESRG